MRIDEFIEKCTELQSTTELAYRSASPAFKLSNSNGKQFSITVEEATQALKDLRDNLEQLLPHTHYVEATWRGLFSRILTHDVTHALCTVQTLPLFIALNKIIVAANDLDDYQDKDIQISEEYFDNAIDYLETQLLGRDIYLDAIEPSNAHITTGINKIYYGAPGTGKSYTIDQKTNVVDTFRTVFHPDTQYSDFIGSLKPAMVGRDINYSFRPGSFTDAIVHAVTHPEAKCTLVIEEINRAAAAAAFGEIFQLLDRDITRKSKYPIHVSDPDWLAYLNSKTNNFFADGKLYIPSNLSLLATMNSSDQAVMPLDTAFKRRWLFEYLPLDYDNAADGTLPLPLETPTGDVEVKLVKWSHFAKTINEALAEDHIPEDKLLGHRFLDSSELNDNGASALKGKLFMYLWDDVLRHGQRGAVFAEYIDEGSDQVELTTYGQLIKAYDAKNNVLRDSISEKLYQLTLAHEERA
ncbi:AAA family ATPase [Vibrio kasasachensis]|uniref:AAA family ATPase n=1 Tax=Vibrio kasasachensis TaxID=2910248 RepID=UPI003D0D19B4